MRTLAILCTAALATAAALPFGASAQTPESERIRITDPAQLVRWGYAPDARDIYAKVGYDTATLSGVEHEGGSRGIIPPGQRYWATATGFSFHPLSNNGEYVKGPSFLVLNGAVVVTGAERVLEAQYEFLDGSDLRFVETFGFHNHASHEFVFNTIERCLPYLVAGNPVETVLVSSTVTNAGGNFIISHTFPDGGHPVNARDCSYHTRAIFGSGGVAPALAMHLTKVRAELSK